MAETAAAQLHRILHLVPHLADGKLHQLSEVAAKAGVPANASFMRVEGRRALAAR